MAQTETPNLPPTVASLTAVIERVMALSDAPTVSVRDLVTGFGEASFLPFLLVPALIVVSPLSGIPLLSTTCGTIIALIALQMLLPRRTHLWLPDVVMRQQIATQAARRGAAAARETGALDRQPLPPAASDPRSPADVGRGAGDVLSLRGDDAISRACALLVVHSRLGGGAFRRRIPGARRPFHARCHRRRDAGRVDPLSGRLRGNGRVGRQVRP